MFLAGRMAFGSPGELESLLCCNPNSLKFLSPLAWNCVLSVILHTICSAHHWIGAVSLAVIWEREILQACYWNRKYYREKVMKFPSQEMFPETLAALKERLYFWYCRPTVRIAIRCLKLLYNNAKWWLNHTWRSSWTTAENTLPDTIILSIFWVANLMCGPDSPALEGATPGTRSGKMGKGNLCHIC